MHIHILEFYRIVVGIHESITLASTTRYDFPTVIGFFNIIGNNPIEFGRRIVWFRNHPQGYIDILFSDQYSTTSPKFDCLFLAISRIITRSTIFYMECKSAPPSSSAETFSPVAAFTRGGPATILQLSYHYRVI